MTRDDQTAAPRVKTLEHAGLLEDLAHLPAYLVPGHEQGLAQSGNVSCSYCGVGDGGVLRGAAQNTPVPASPGTGTLTVRLKGEQVRLPATVGEEGEVEVKTRIALTPSRGIVTGTLAIGEQSASFMGREVATDVDGDAPEPGAITAQRFEPYSPRVKVTQFKIDQPQPTTGCVKLRISTMRQRSAYPIHTVPSVLDAATGERRAISYREAIARLAELVLRHRAPDGRSLIYASGQIDYFTIFAMQEVFRLLGVRNLTGNAEHCLNAGAVHNEILTGQEGPFITLAQALDGPNRVYLMNGWNGMVTHPPVYRALTKRSQLDGYLVEVMVTETAKGMAQKMGAERVLLIRPRSDAHLALAVAHEIFDHHADAVEKRFVERFAEPESFERWRQLATSAQYAPERVAERIAPEPRYRERLAKAIRMLAIKLADPDTVPIAIPSVGLSQSSGVVAHCLWGNVLGMLGKYGLKPDGTPAGGVLRVPGQINAESEVQALSRKYFTGRIPMARAAEAARRMDLPEDAYQRAVDDPPRAALDYSEPTPGERELFLCVGTQFEANMPNRRRWLDKLKDPANTLVVIDPIPDPWSEKHAELIIPSPPHPATTKLYQNGEWKLTLSVPQKRAAPETRSDATILYDAMAEIVGRLEADEEVAGAHPDLEKLLDSGYLRERFCPPENGHEGLARVDGEVSRVELWQRIQSYLHGGSGPLYCSFDHADGTPIEWRELLERGSVVYGGVGENRYLLDYDDPEATPFRDVFRQPGAFRFFQPTGQDLEIPEGVLLNSGRSSLSDDRARIHFATSTFNSGKATPVVKMPEEHPLHVSPYLAERTGLETGDTAKIASPDHGASIELPVVVTDRVKGESVYVSFHRSGAQDARGLYVNDVTDHVGRCPYSGQVQLKIPRVTVERVDRTAVEVARAAGAAATDAVPAMVAPAVEAPAVVVPRRIDMTVLDTEKKIPMWTGEETPLFVTDVFQETHDVFTFRFQGDPLCRFVYKPGQFSSVVLDLDGERVVRSYTISSPPTRPYTLELTIKRVPGGRVSNWMPDHLKVGDRVRLKGPKGRFCLEPGKIPKKILFVAAGSGATPIMAMSRWLCDVSADVDIKLFCSVRSSQDIIFGKEIEMMTERYRLFTPCVISTTRGQNEPWTGLTGRVNRRMLQMVAPDLHERHVYMCGPEGFMDAVKDILREIHFDFERLHLESFGGIRTATAKIPVRIQGKTAMTVQFAQAGKTVPADGTMTLLELAEDADVDVDYGCRSGSCQDCKIRLLSGKVDGGSEGLSEEEVAAGTILSCVATPIESCVVDA